MCDKECGTAPGNPPGPFPGTVPGSPPNTFQEFLSSTPLWCQRLRNPRRTRKSQSQIASGDSLARKLCCTNDVSFFAEESQIAMLISIGVDHAHRPLDLLVPLLTGEDLQNYGASPQTGGKWSGEDSDGSAEIYPRFVCYQGFPRAPRIMNVYNSKHALRLEQGCCIMQRSCKRCL